MFHEAILRDQGGEGGWRDEEISYAIDLIGTRLACCMGCGHCECIGMRVAELLTKRPFTNA